MIFIKLVSLGRFYQELHKPGLPRWSKLHHHFYIIFLPLLKSLRQHLGIRTDAELPLPNSIHYIKGIRLVSVYTSEFRQLAWNVQWDGQALCDHFHQGLRSEIKHLLLNFPEPASLSQAIMQAISCDNWFFELAQEERATSRWHPSLRSTPSSLYNDPMRIEIDRAWAK